MTTAQRHAWHQAKKEARRITDKLGMPIDRGILDTVVVLRLLGINTTGSCGGHLDRRNTSGPYVDFRPKLTKEYELQAQAIGDPKDPLYKRLRHKAMEVNIREMQKLLPYLDAFYQGRDTPQSQRLIVKHFGHLTNFLMCQGAALTLIGDRVTRKDLLLQHQAEMKAFTDYLKATWEKGDGVAFPSPQVRQGKSHTAT